MSAIIVWVVSMITLLTVFISNKHKVQLKLKRLKGGTVPGSVLNNYQGCAHVPQGPNKSVDFGVHLTVTKQ